MSKPLFFPLVGMHFNPPAKNLIAVLPQGAKLTLRPEPENPYDSNAVQVFVDFSEVPEDQYEELTATLEGSGFSLSELAEAEGPWLLGHVGRTGGKPCVMAGLPGNEELLAEVAKRGGDWSGLEPELGFDVKGLPVVGLAPQVEEGA